MSEDVEFQRLRWRCRRGMRELDQILLNYLLVHWRQAPTADRALFLQILETEDDNLWRWCMNREQPEDPALEQFVRKLIDLSH